MGVQVAIYVQPQTWVSNSPCRSGMRRTSSALGTPGRARYGQQMPQTSVDRRTSPPIGLPTLGVIGGMGPLATADFLEKVTRATPARCDQEHIPLVLCSIPQIPDRTGAILHGGSSPLPVLLRALKILESSGADYIAVPCNTAHFWHAQLQARSSVKILHIADAVVAAIWARGLRGSTVGLLATTATIEGRVYQRRLAAQGVRTIVPGADDQRALMSLIYRIKSGAPPAHPGEFDALISGLASNGADAIVLGCTELPLIKTSECVGPLIDSTAALARLCVAHALDAHFWRADDDGAEVAG